jgi:hypothetical protein
VDNSSWDTCSTLFLLWLLSSGIDIGTGMDMGSLVNKFAVVEHNYIAGRNNLHTVGNMYLAYCMAYKNCLGNSRCSSDSIPDWQYRSNNLNRKHNKNLNCRGSNSWN